MWRWVSPFACSWLRSCAEARRFLGLSFACGGAPAECSCTRFAASRTGCKFMHWWEGEREGAGLAPPRTVGDAATCPGGSQEAPEESRKLLVCSRKAPGRLRKRSPWPGESPGARILCVLRDTGYECMHGWEGEREGAGLAPPRTLGDAATRPGGSQEAPEESRKLLVCFRKAPGSLRTRSP